MAYTIYGKNGTAKKNAAGEDVKVTSLECSQEWMGDATVVCRVTSAYPILWEVGDYVDYQGDRYAVTNRQGLDKQGRPGATREAFVYDVRLEGYGRELKACEMRDVVLSTDHNTHYTAMRDWTLYCQDVRTFAERVSANLARLYNGAWTVTVTTNAPVDGAQNIVVHVTDENVKEALDHIKDDFGLGYTIRGRRIIIWTRRDAATAGLTMPMDFIYGKESGLWKITQAVDNDHKVVTLLRAYGNTNNLPLRYYNTGTTLPDNLNVRNLMLPSFGRSGLNGVIASVYTDSRYAMAKTKLTALGFDTEAKLRARFAFAESASDAWIKSKRAEEYGIVEGSVTFDGNEEGYDDIYPSIRYVGGNADKIVSADAVTDNGVFGEGVEIPDFYVVVNTGFDPSEHIPFGASSFKVAMVDGYCGGREFECVGVEAVSGGYRLRMRRELDDALGLYFPYTQNGSGAYNIKAGDRFVLLGIEMPAEYVERTAINALLPSAIGWLAEHDETRCKYQLSVDEIQMQRWCDEQRADGVATIHDTIRAGLMLSLADYDIQIGGAVAIDKLVIKEMEDALPKYDITLSEEKEWSSIKKLNNKLKYNSWEVEAGQDGKPGKDGKDGIDAASYRLVPSAKSFMLIPTTTKGRATAITPGDGSLIGGGGSTDDGLAVRVTWRPDKVSVRRVKRVGFVDEPTDEGTIFVSITEPDEGEDEVFEPYAGPVGPQVAEQKRIKFVWKDTDEQDWEMAKSRPTIDEVEIPLLVAQKNLSVEAGKLFVDRGQVNLNEAYAITSGDEYDEDDLQSIIIGGKNYNLKGRTRISEQQIDDIWAEYFGGGDDGGGGGVTSGEQIDPGEGTLTPGGQGTAIDSPDRPTLNL